MDDIELLNAVMTGFDFESDTEFADYLNIDRSTISNIKNGKQKMSILLKLRLLDKLGYLATSSLVESITPASISERIRSFNQENARRTAKVNREARSTNEPGNTSSQTLIEFIEETIEGCKAKRQEATIEKLSSIKSKISNGQSLETLDRIQIAEGLHTLDREMWPLSILNITQYCANDELLAHELQRVSTATFLEKFKRLLNSKSDKQLAKDLGVTSQTISALRKNPDNLGSPTGLKILYGLGDKGVITDFDTKELKQILEDNSRFYTFVQNSTSKEED